MFDANLNLNDELYSQKKLIEMSQGCDGILSALTDKLDADTINQLPDSVKILSNFVISFLWFSLKFSIFNRLSSRIFN